MNVNNSSQFLAREALENSNIVANCTMNRERKLLAENSYSQELGFNLLEFLQARLQGQNPAIWLDLCCGTGRALIQGAEYFYGRNLGDRMTLIGVDLVDLFYPHPTEFTFLHLTNCSLFDYQFDREYDLVTCVHGLHYLGDKLQAIARAVAALTPQGLFIAHLDPNNLKFPGKMTGRKAIAQLQQQGLNYNPEKHLLCCQGKRELELNYEYLGARDTAGKNYTGQAAIDSYYN
ncbi:MAG: class I SAM-dependent methyltransferase [Cyanobacteria bacterium P01_E01_bin.42]